MKIKLIFIFSILLIFTGCGKKYSITPDRLPTAYVNQEYKQTIKISGGKVVDQYAKLDTNIPKDLGIVVQPINNLDGYNRSLAKVIIASLSGLRVQQLS